MATSQEMISECPDERRQFDQFKERLFDGHALMYMAQSLFQYGQSLPGGSYEQHCYIMSNECAQAHKRIQELEQENKRLKEKLTQT